MRRSCDLIHSLGSLARDHHQHWHFLRAHHHCHQNHLRHNHFHRYLLTVRGELKFYFLYAIQESTDPNNFYCLINSFDFNYFLCYFVPFMSLQYHSSEFIAQHYCQLSRSFANLTSFSVNFAGFFCFLQIPCLDEMIVDVLRGPRCQLRCYQLIIIFYFCAPSCFPWRTVWAVQSFPCSQADPDDLLRRLLRCSFLIHWPHSNEFNCFF